MINATVVKSDFVLDLKMRDGLDQLNETTSKETFDMCIRQLKSNYTNPLLEYAEDIATYSIRNKWMTKVYTWLAFNDVNRSRLNAECDHFLRTGELPADDLVARMKYQIDRTKAFLSEHSQQ